MHLLCSVDHNVYHPVIAYQAGSVRHEGGTTAGYTASGLPVVLMAVEDRWGSESMCMFRTVPHQDGGTASIVALGVRQRREVASRSEIPAVGTQVTRLLFSWENWRKLSALYAFDTKPTTPKLRQLTIGFPQRAAHAGNASLNTLAAWFDGERALHAARASGAAVVSLPHATVPGGGGDNDNGYVNDSDLGCNSNSGGHEHAGDGGLHRDMDRLALVQVVANSIHARLQPLVSVDEADGDHVSACGWSDSDADVCAAHGAVDEDGQHVHVEPDDDEVLSVADVAISDIHGHVAHFSDQPEGGSVDAPTAEDDSELEIPPGRIDCERVIQTKARIMTAGQGCWDWFCMRRGHITSTMAQELGAIARSIAACKPGSSALRDAVDTLPAYLARAWHGSWDGRPPARARGGDTFRIMEALRLDSVVDGIFEVGLVENRATPWLAASASGYGRLNSDALGARLAAGGEHAAALRCVQSSARLYVPFVFQTLAGADADAYKEVRHRFTDDGWAVCSIGDDRFRQLVPQLAHRDHLVHNLATFEAQAVVFVVSSTDEGIVTRTLVLPDTGVIRCHVKVLEEFVRLLFGWMHLTRQARAPEWMHPAMAQLHESHQELWWVVRQYVLAHGAMPPVLLVRGAMVVIHNK